MQFSLDASLDAATLPVLVRFSGNDTVGLATVAGSEIGVLGKRLPGNVGLVALSGAGVQVRAGAALVAGDRITTDGQGRAIPGGSFGIVTTGAAAAGDLATVSVQPVPIVNVNATLDTPKTSDGRVVINPSIFPGGVALQLLGRADSATERGAGAKFSLARATAGDETLSFGFGDSIYLAGGQVTWTGAGLGDDVRMDLDAPASVVTPNGGGTGNCNLIPMQGGGNLIIPAAGDGDYDVTLATAVPVPAWDEESGEAPTGFWNWSDPPVGKGVITPSAPGAGYFYLFDVPIPLARFVVDMQLLGAGTMDVAIPNIKTKKILPQWRFLTTLHNETGGDLKVVWLVVGARKQTRGALP